MHKSMFARILVCLMSLAISAVVMLAQDAGSKSAKTDQQPALHAESGTMLRLGTFTRSRLMSARGRPRPIGLRRKKA